MLCLFFVLVPLHIVCVLWSYNHHEQGAHLTLFKAPYLTRPDTGSIPEGSCLSSFKPPTYKTYHGNMNNKLGLYASKEQREEVG